MPSTRLAAAQELAHETARGDLYICRTVMTGEPWGSVEVQETNDPAEPLGRVRRVFVQHFDGDTALTDAEAEQLGYALIAAANMARGTW